MFIGASLEAYQLHPEPASLGRTQRPVAERVEQIVALGGPGDVELDDVQREQAVVHPQVAASQILPREAHRQGVGVEAGVAPGDDQHRAELLALAHLRTALGRRERRAIGAVARQGALIGEVRMHVCPQPIELTGPIGMARALVFDHRNARQARPQVAQCLCAIVHRLAVRRELA
jgi:hypothetical protein